MAHEEALLSISSSIQHHQHLPSPSSSAVFKVALCQLTSTDQLDRNTQVASSLVSRISREFNDHSSPPSDQVRFICFPENTAFLGDTVKMLSSRPDLTNLKRLDPYLQLAKDHGVWLSIGGFHERIPPHLLPKENQDQIKIFNSHVLINDKGEIASLYRKIHLFDVNIPNGPSHCESKVTQPGSEFVTCDTPFGRIGLSVCYDLRFPEMFSILRKKGAQIILVPSAFTAHTGRAHWHTLLRARAIETQCFVLAAAQTGKHNEKRESFGHSLVVDPWGEVLADMDADRSSDFVVTTIDLEKCQRVREAIPIQAHRREDLYRGHFL